MSTNYNTNTLVNSIQAGSLSEVVNETKPMLTLPWTPTSELIDRIMKRSEKRGWGFTKTDADKLAITMHDHCGDLYPTSVKLWLGKTLKFNWYELMLWIKDEVEALGYEFKERFSVSQLSFFPGSEMSGKKSLEIADLDLQTFLKPNDGVEVKDERPRREKWPGLEVAVMLALNPQIYIMMDGRVVPYMLVAGLAVGSNLGSSCIYVPYFYRNGLELDVYDYWDGHRWGQATIVSFRDYA